MSMTASSGLLDQARAVEVDVFGSSVTCDTVQDAPSSDATFRFAASQPIQFDVPPGTHTVLLTAFSDDAATVPLATACAQHDFSAHAQICLDLVLEALPDGSAVDLSATDGNVVDLAKPDLMPPPCPVTAKTCGSGASAICCDPSNGSCSASCVLSCNAGYGNCDTFLSNGCESPLTTTSNCTACGAACDTAHSTPSGCNGSKCLYSACATNWQNCDTSGVDTAGCECEGSSCCGSGCQNKHSDGYGDSFFDCQPLNTFNQNQASEAELAFDPGGTIDPSINPWHYTDNKGTSDQMCVRSYTRNTCICFIYAATGNYVPWIGRSYSSGKPGSCTPYLVNSSLSNDAYWN
jgi:hypothetical protein